MRAVHWLCVLCYLLSTGEALAWNSHRLKDPLRVNSHTSPYADFAVYLKSGETLRISFASGAPGSLRLRGEELPLGPTGVPVPAEPGRYPLEITNLASGETSRLQLFVLVPLDAIDEEGYLNGYRIGRYPDEPLGGHPIYLPPSGLVEVHEDMLDVPVSPNFRLGDFLCKQAGDFPKYVVLRASLMLKLENILAALNRSGRRTDRLTVMSGYRTPWYNASIGNGAYSRHIWGGAADVFIDESPRDGEMDDLNGDGLYDRQDAEWLAAFVDDMSARGEFGPRIGGLGIYGRNRAHGPFIHVDARGMRARW
jgi:hypothetical protein